MTKEILRTVKKSFPSKCQIAILLNLPQNSRKRISLQNWIVLVLWQEFSFKGRWAIFNRLQFLRFGTFSSFWAVQNTTKLHFNFINLFPIKPTLTCAMEYNKWEGRALCPIQVAPCSGFPFRVEACTSCLVPQINASSITALTVLTLVVLQAF